MRLESVISACLEQTQVSGKQTDTYYSRIWVEKTDNENGSILFRVESDRVSGLAKAVHRSGFHC